MVRFPKEPHGIRGAYPSHRVAKVDYILAWMERFTGRGQ
jgi:dipeptidyl aminopeptidase/acylaminoacyl peptidase